MTLRGVRLAAGGRTLLDDVSLNVLSGELVAIVGPNGVGKTTLLRALAGLTRPLRGEVTIDGVAVSELDARARAQTVALVGGDVETPYGMSLREVVLTGRFAHRAWWDWTQSDADLIATDAALERVALTAYADRPFDTLSSGERQRGWIALALAQRARVLLLDEPTSHLDARYALEILMLLRVLAHDATSVVVVLHDLNQAAAVADRIAVLGEGRLLRYDAPEEALDPRILERAFGVPFERVTVGGRTSVLARGPQVADARTFARET